MAKRKRLDLPTETDLPVLETNPAYPGMSRMPIAEVAGDTAARAALDEVARTMALVEAEGRLVHKIAIDRVDLTHLNRDRMVFEPEEMEVLKTSLATRGQQTPVEVLALPSGRFGLISGLRRLEALKALGEIEVLAFLRKPQDASASYVAMVEENEIRAGLSFYERANIVVQAIGAGVYRTPQEAVKALFASVPSAKRSKILRFVQLHEQLGQALRFPTAISEKLGLALANALEADTALATRVKDALRKTPPADPAGERRALERALKSAAAPAPSGKEVAPGITLKTASRRMTLAGKGVDAGFEKDLLAWLATR